MKLTFDHAIESVRAEFQTLYRARRDELVRLAETHGWTWSLSHTDALASTALVRLHGLMTGDRRR